MQLLPPSNKSARGAGRDGCENCARHVLNITPPVVRAIRGLMRDHRLQGLSVPQFRALAVMSFSPYASLSLVADYVGSSLPAASRMVDGLVAKKLVARHESLKDRRQISLALTPRGQSAFSASREVTHQKLAERLAELTPIQRRKVVEGLRCLAGIFGTDSFRAEAEGYGTASDRRHAIKKGTAPQSRTKKNSTKAGPG
ncbi:MAG: MarR family transcriptional regulator [Planctomycetota bacterium]|nr:MarR family transcriptional regulator [Planctomycetota bacterium]